MPKRNRYRKHLTESKRRTIAARQQWRCFHCHELLDARFTIDHQIPLCLGGKDALHNMAALCGGCNDVKTREDMQRFWDVKEEQKTGVSRFWNPYAIDFIPPLTFADFHKKLGWESNSHG